MRESQGVGDVAGVTYIAERRQYAAGTLPVPAYRLDRLTMVGESLAAAGISAWWWWWW